MDVLLGHGLSDIGFICQLFNALFIVIFINNWDHVLQTQRQWATYLVVFLVPNLLWALVAFYASHRYPILQAIELIASFPFISARLIESFVSPSMELVVFAFLIALSSSVPMVNSKKYSARTAMTTSAAVFVSVFMFMFITGIHLSLLVQFRLATIAAVFFVVCLYDIRQQSRTIQPMDLLPHYILALMKTLLLFPVLMVIVAAVFLTIVVFTDALGIPSSVVNTPVYIGVIYGPFAAVYWICKSNWKSFVKLSDLPF